MRVRSRREVTAAVAAAVALAVALAACSSSTAQSASSTPSPTSSAQTTAGQTSSAAGTSAESSSGTPNDTSGSSAPTGPLQDINVTVYPGTIASIGIYVADAMGFFKQHGLAVKYVNVGTAGSANAVLASGDTDVIIQNADGLEDSRKAGLDAVLIAGETNRYFGALVCQPDIDMAAAYPESMQALVGKKIGITTPGTITDNFARLSLKDAGVDPSKAQFIPVNGLPQLIAAFQSKAIDCVSAYQPMQEQLGQFKVAVDWQAGQGPAVLSSGYLAQGFITSAAFLKAHPDIAKSFTLSIIDAITFAKDPKNLDAIVEAVQPQFYSALDKPTFKKVLAGVADILDYHVIKQEVLNASAMYKELKGADFTNTYDQLVAPEFQDLIGG